MKSRYHTKIWIQVQKILNTDMRGISKKNVHLNRSDHQGQYKTHQFKNSKTRVILNDIIVVGNATKRRTVIIIKRQ